MTLSSASALPSFHAANIPVISGWSFAVMPIEMLSKSRNSWRGAKTFRFSFVSLSASEGDTRAEAYDTRVSVTIKRGGAGNLTKGRAGYAGVRIAEIRMIEDIEEIGTDFAVNELREFEPLDNGAVEH